jgi:DNA-binding transcriptional LysR family regulator
MLDWNDLRYALAIGRHRGLAGAAETLAVNHSTVFRRLNAIEAQLGVKLFERAGGEYHPTDAGARVLAAAERVEAEALSLDRELAGGDAKLSGELRVTSSETLAFSALTLEIARFRSFHPGIRVELVVDNRQVDLSRREADVALRATRPRRGDLFGRKLADIAWAVYGAPGYVAERGAPERVADLAEHVMIGWGTGTTGIGTATWLAGAVPDRAIAYRSSSLINQLVAARSGIGLAVLPRYLAEPDPGLIRVLPPIADLDRELWLITHSALKGTARVRAFMDVVGEGVRRRLTSSETVAGSESPDG